MDQRLTNFYDGGHKCPSSKLDREDGNNLTTLSTNVCSSGHRELSVGYHSSIFSDKDPSWPTCVPSSKPTGDYSGVVTSYNNQTDSDGRCYDSSTTDSAHTANLIESPNSSVECSSLATDLSDIVEPLAAYKTPSYPWDKKLTRADYFDADVQHNSSKASNEDYGYNSFNMPPTFDSAPVFYGNMDSHACFYNNDYSDANFIDNRPFNKTLIQDARTEYSSLQNTLTWKPDITSGAKDDLITSPETICNNEIEKTRRTKYYEDDFMFTNTVSPQSFLVSQEGAVPHFAAATRQFDNGENLNEEYVANRAIMLARQQEETVAFNGEKSRTVALPKLYDMSSTTSAASLPDFLHHQAEAKDDKTDRKSKPKLKAKKTESIESLQHQLEALAEKRRQGSSQRMLGCQLGGSCEQSNDTASIIDVDHMISSGVTVAGFKPRAIIRKRCKSSTPVDVKNQDYWYRRRKNNDSARKSRESKKEKEKKFYKRALELEYENIYLNECLHLAETELASLGRQFMPPPFEQDNIYY